MSIDKAVMPKSVNGEKNDDGKRRYSLLPQDTLDQVVDVLEFGAIKYVEANNWQKVENPQERYYNASMRHIQSWWSGEKNDKETGKHHLAHAVCCLLFLIWFDDRKPIVHKFAYNIFSNLAEGQKR